MTATVVAPALPASLAANPRLSQWLSIHTDGTVSVRTGKVELGQGIATALAQIVSEELDVSMSRIHMVAARTLTSPNEGMTAGSMSVLDSGGALRQVCAEARAIYLQLAAQRLGLPPDQSARLNVMDGVITAPGVAGSTSYGALAEDSLLDREADGQARPKRAPPLGTGDSVRGVERLDIPDKVTGQPRFIHDMRLPGMLFGRVVHPPSPGAALATVEFAAVEAMPGVVATVRDGSFLGVIAADEYTAGQARDKLATLAQWQSPATLPDMADLPGWLRGQALDTSVVAEKTGDAATSGTLQDGSGQHFSATYSRPFLAHGSIGLCCAIARHQPDSVEVWTHSQGIYPLRTDLALMLGVPASNISVQHVEGAGCYGHNGADDVACEAVLMARAVPGRAVQVQWTREDELGCAPFGAAMVVGMQAHVTVDGRIADWEHQIWSNGHSSRPGRSKVPIFLASTLVEKPFEPQLAINVPLAAGGGGERNAVPTYDFAKWRAVSHRALSMPIRTSSLRSLGAHCNVFASESFLDEIASAKGLDPLALRLQHLTDPRSRAVLEAVADMSGWANRDEARAGTEGLGMGIAFTRYKNNGAYCAVVARIEAGREVRVSQLWIAVDVGRVVSLDGVVNQIEGGAIQTVSWTLKEAVAFDRTRILSNTWDAYPILRFSEVPAVSVQVIDRPGEKSMGAGEATHGPVSAAIANALAHALGVRVRNLPLTHDNITRAALAGEP